MHGSTRHVCTPSLALCTRCLAAVWLPCTSSLHLHTLCQTPVNDSSLVSPHWDVELAAERLDRALIAILLANPFDLITESAKKLWVTCPAAVPWLLLGDIICR